ncbi:MAG: outer membrane beta-barrel protein [Ignavibacteria bacterium]|nr:outer membrane beta-barrel protein [Ignavibacteria bacterium]
MKKLYSTLCLIFFPLSLVFPQGFDWEYSPRLPFSIPRVYFGIGGNTAKNYYNGSFSLFENFYTCSKFTSGTGNSFALGLKSEYWFKPNFAFAFTLLYQNSSANFVASGDSFPILLKNIPKMVKVENELSLRYKYLLLDLGAKYHIASTFFFIAAGLEFGVRFSSSFDIHEQVKSPPEFHFADNTQRRKVINGKLSDLALFSVVPKISLGYDAKIFPGLYASPNFSLQLPVFNLSLEENLKLFSLQLSISFLYGIW